MRLSLRVFAPRIVMQVCHSCETENAAESRFCSACGATLGGARPPGGEARQTVTVVFSDLMASTTLGESLDHESLRRVMSRYYDGMDRVLRRHGRPARRFIGDAVMAVFGVHVLNEDDALRAVRAAGAMAVALEKLNEELDREFGLRLRARTGVNTGEIVVGDRHDSELFVVGDTVNVAARLEEAAPEGGILIGAETYRLVRDSVAAEPVEPLTLKGKSEPVPAYRVLDVLSGTRGEAAGLDSPMVGRERELELLEQALERSVASGRCSLVTLLGHAGIGKSRLAREFVAHSAGRAVAVGGRCPPYGEDITFWPIAEVVRELAKVDEGDSPETAHQKLLGLVGATEEAAAIVEGVASAIGLGEPTAQRAEIFWAVRRLLEEISRRLPLIVVIDDVQWAAPTLLDLVEYVTDTSQGHPILLLCVARPELGEVRPALRAPEPPAQAITLGRLNEGESSALVEKLLAGGELPDDVRARLVAAADGNPLFLEQLVHMLGDDGELRQIEGRWGFASELPELSLPPTIHAIVAARLHRLPPGERAVVECASVVGQEFWPTAVGELTQPEPEKADLHLESLLDKELIRAGSTRLAGEQALRFSHIVIRDVAYQTILKDTRARLHERVASWLQGRAGERAGEYEELVGYHLEQAYRYHTDLGRPAAHAAKLGKEAAERIGSAGRRALVRGDMPAATSLLERAVSLLPEADPLRSELSLRLSIALAETGELKRADALLSERIEAERRDQHYLLYRDGEGRQRLHDIDAANAPITIGRRAVNDIALGWDGEVSRSHARLEWAAGEWALVDQGLSSNGSYVNGQRIEGRHRLHDGDVLRFGETVLLFRAPLGSGVHFRKAAESASTVTRPVPRGL